MVGLSDQDSTFTDHTPGGRVSGGCQIGQLSSEEVLNEFNVLLLSVLLRDTLLGVP